MRVLTVDDSRTIRLLVRQALGPLGFEEMMEAENGAVALSKIAQAKPDIIILDVTMPVMDGPTTLKKLRESEEFKGIPVIMLTAEAEKAVVMSIIQLGVCSYLLKPFQSDQLVSEVRKALDLDGEGSSSLVGDTGLNGDGKPVVMVVDDKAMVVESARKYLGGLCRVVGTTDASEVVKLASRNSPEVVFLDLVIPNVNVFEIFSILKAQPDLKRARFVAIAIRTMRDEALRAKKAGFDDLLMKPFSEESIQKVLRRNLKGAEDLLSYGPGYAAFKFPSADGYGVAQGTFTQQTLKQATEAFYEVADGGCQRLLLDLGNVGKSDTSLLTCLTAMQKNAEELGIELGIIAPQKTLARSLRDLSETSRMPLFGSMEEALARAPDRNDVVAG